jgi:hypothetical protein
MVITPGESKKKDNNKTHTLILPKNLVGNVGMNVKNL